MLASQEKQCSCDSDARAIAAFVQGVKWRYFGKKSIVQPAKEKARRLLREGKLGKL